MSEPNEEYNDDCIIAIIEADMESRMAPRSQEVEQGLYAAISRFVQHHKTCIGIAFGSMMVFGQGVIGSAVDKGKQAVNGMQYSLASIHQSIIGYFDNNQAQNISNVGARALQMNPMRDRRNENHDLWKNEEDESKKFVFGAPTGEEEPNPNASPDEWRIKEWIGKSLEWQSYWSESLWQRYFGANWQHVMNDVILKHTLFDNKDAKNWETFTYGDGIRYTGQMKGKMPHGNGIMDFLDIDGRVYAGTFEDGHLICGVKKELDGRVFIGNFTQHGFEGKVYKNDGTNANEAPKNKFVEGDWVAWKDSKGHHEAQVMNAFRATDPNVLVREKDQMPEQVARDDLKQIKPPNRQ